MFCLPAGLQTIIGTTDTWTDESPESVHPTASDVDYLLRSANSYFPRAELTLDDVVSAWAGIRPLASAQSGNPTAVSREHTISVDDGGIIHVTGGKLTTYRSMAAEIVDRVQEKLGKKVRAAKTDSVPLPGAKRATEIDRLQRDDRRLAQRLSPDLSYTGAHLVYGVTHEKAQTLSDLLIRRTHLAAPGLGSPLPRRRFMGYACVVSPSPRAVSCAAARTAPHGPSNGGRLPGPLRGPQAPRPGQSLRLPFSYALSASIVTNGGGLRSSSVSSASSVWRFCRSRLIVAIARRLPPTM